MHFTRDLNFNMTGPPPVTYPLQGTFTEVYLSLLSDQAIWQGDLGTSLRRVMAGCAEALGAAQVSLWRWHEQGHQLHCTDVWAQGGAQSPPSFRITAHEHSAYLHALEQQALITSHHAAQAPELAELYPHHIEPRNVGGRLDLPLTLGLKRLGVLTIEHLAPARPWSQAEQSFVLAIGHLLKHILHRHQLESQEERYRGVFEATDHAILIMQASCIVDCNAAALKLFQCDRDTFFRHSPHRFWAEQQADGKPSMPAAERLLSAAFAGKPQLFQWRLRRFDGSEFDGEVHLKRIELNGEPHLVAAITDTTVRVATEQQIAQLLTLQQAIFDGANYSIIATDVQGNIKSFNRAASQLLGYSCAAVVGRLPLTDFHDSNELSWRAIELSDELNTTLEPGFEALVAHARLGHTEEREWTYIHQDGSRVPVQVSVTPLRENGTEISGFLAIASDLTERKRRDQQLLRSQRQVEHIARHDDLTGLPNRARLHEIAGKAIARAKNKHHQVALMLLDLNRFKEVNDTLGHTLGDQLLMRIAQRLDDVLKTHSAHLFRLGGDEFAILMPLALDDVDAENLARRVHASLRSPITIDEVTLELGGSIGISIYPQHGDNSHSLLRCADVAMYKAKSESTGTMLYHAKNDAHSPRRLTMMAELGTAIRENQLVLHYQPRVSLANNSCFGCEALVRWQHPQLGLVPPGEFIPVAEMSDLIQSLGLWVLETALKQIKVWQNKGLNLVVSINLSTRNLMDYTFPSHIERMLAQYKVPPQLLEIEITESTLIGDPERALHVINRIHKIGVRFAIDDFGTGYSSLSYLKRLPIDTLKIDRSFIHDMLTDEQDAVIVRSTLGLAHSFGLEVVAEGVEDQATLEVLRTLQCEQAQGFLISRPVPHAEFELWLSRFTQSRPGLH